MQIRVPRRRLGRIAKISKKRGRLHDPDRPRLLQTYERHHTSELLQSAEHITVTFLRLNFISSWKYSTTFEASYVFLLPATCCRLATCDTENRASSRSLDKKQLSRVSWWHWDFGMTPTFFFLSQTPILFVARTYTALGSKEIMPKSRDVDQCKQNVW